MSHISIDFLNIFNFFDLFPDFFRYFFLHFPTFYLLFGLFCHFLRFFTIFYRFFTIFSLFWSFSTSSSMMKWNLMTSWPRPLTTPLTTPILLFSKTKGLLFPLFLGTLLPLYGEFARNVFFSCHVGRQSARLLTTFTSWKCELLLSWLISPCFLVFVTTRRSRLRYITMADVTNRLNDSAWKALLVDDLTFESVTVDEKGRFHPWFSRVKKQRTPIFPLLRLLPTNQYFLSNQNHRKYHMQHYTILHHNISAD